MDTRLSIHPAPVALALILSLALAIPAGATSSRDAAVGAQGELFFVREGSYGEIFPGQGLADPEAPALAVEVVHPDQERELLRVPGSEFVDAINSASVVYEDETDTLFVLYQTRTSIHWRLNLVGLRAGEWTEPIEISGNAYVWKSSPQISVTRDTFRTEETDGTLKPWQRTVVHLLWWEEGPSGEPLVHYSPVVLLDGVYTGWNPVLRLAGLGLASGPVPDFNPPLAQSPRLETGGNGQSVVLGFVLPETGELTTWTAEVLPGEFASLADKVRHQIIEIGRDLDPDQPAVLADRVRHQIIEIGHRLGLHPSIPSYAAVLATAEIEGAAAAGDPVSLADKVRHQIIEIGARLTARGLDRGASSGELEILEIASLAHSGAPPNLIRLAQASLRPSPATGEEGNAMFLSQDGREVVVSWHEGDAVYYRESRDEGWSAVRSLRLGEDLDLPRARKILEQRADERTAE